MRSCELPCAESTVARLHQIDLLWPIPALFKPSTDPWKRILFELIQRALAAERRIQNDLR
jgi:hypothetical protein